MVYTIYKITNQVNGKHYIGKHQTENLNDGYMGSGKLIQQAIQKYGIENFTKEILHICESEEEMNAKEKELVQLGEHTYNMCPSGQGGPINLGRVTPEETKQKISESLKGNIRSEETKQKISITQTGRNLSEETKQKISIARTGMKLSDATKRKLSEKLKGIPRSEKIKELVTHQKNEIQRLQHEVKTLKQKLQYRHTEINDLRYAKRELEKWVAQN